MSDRAIQVSELEHRFGATEALRGVSFDVRRGEIFGLLGPNGAGKTTTIRILLTLLRPMAGQAMVADRDVVADGDAVRRSVGWVPQDRAVDPLLSARENLRFAAGLYHLPSRQVPARTAELLGLVGLEAHSDRLVRDFSGGMRRRLELAMGLVHHPDVLFLDEPTLGLDIAARRMVWAHIEKVRDAGRTILLTTHYLDEADSLCDRVAIIDRGEIRGIGSPRELKRAYGRQTVCFEFAAPVPSLAERLRAHPKVAAVRAGRSGVEAGEDGYAVEADVDDPVLVTDFALTECRQLSVIPRDLWSHRASLDDVFLRLTGQEFSQADETSHAADTGQAERAEPAGETTGHGASAGAGESR